MKHLFCIFNANDPTPTAYAIRSAPYENVTVFVLGRERFGNRQERSLYRLKNGCPGPQRVQKTGRRDYGTNRGTGPNPKQMSNLSRLDAFRKVFLK